MVVHFSLMNISIVICKYIFSSLKEDGRLHWDYLDIYRDEESSEDDDDDDDDDEYYDDEGDGEGSDDEEEEVFVFDVDEEPQISMV